MESYRELVRSAEVALIIGLIASAMGISDMASVYVLLSLAFVVGCVATITDSALVRRAKLMLCAAIFTVVCGAGYFISYRHETTVAQARYAGNLEFPSHVIFSSSTKYTKRKLEIGRSRTVFFTERENMPLFMVTEDSEILIELIDGKPRISTKVHDYNGKLVAELFRNEWKVAPPPATWDRNYSDDALEVRDDRGLIILQIKVLPDRIQLQGEFWSADGSGMRLVENEDLGKGGFFF